MCLKYILLPTYTNSQHIHSSLWAFAFKIALFYHRPFLCLLLLYGPSHPIPTIQALSVSFSQFVLPFIHHVVLGKTRKDQRWGGSYTAHNSLPRPTSLSPSTGCASLHITIPVSPPVRRLIIEKAIPDPTACLSAFGLSISTCIEGRSHITLW